MAQAPTADDILTESDAANILEELTEAQNCANLLGFMLGIKPVEVDAICKMYQNPKERLCQIILAFLRQAEPPPTWRAIVNALRSNAVNLTALAKRVEAAHFPDPTASRDPPTTSVKDVTPQLPAVSTSYQLPTTSDWSPSNSCSSLKNTGNKLTVQCQQKKRAPCEMFRGSATTDRRFVYFTPFGYYKSLYQYEYSTEKWSDLPPCPYRDSGLATIDSELTTVGGRHDIYIFSNKLFTLQQKKWVEKYPPMNTARSSPAVVGTSDGDYLIVIGGEIGDDRWTATVELFQVKNRKWHKLAHLPQPLPAPSATICGDLLNVIGDDDSGYSCSLQALPSSDRPITSPLTLSWQPLPHLPVAYSTAATLCGQLVIIGGTEGWSPVNSILQLVDGEWVRIGSMASNRYYCLVASPSPDRIIIVGGLVDPLGILDSVEECEVL